MNKKWLTPEHERLLRHEPHGNPFQLSQAVDDAARDRRHDLLPFIELHFEAQEEMLRASALAGVVAPLLVVKHIPRALAALRADPESMVRSAITIALKMYLANEEPYRAEIMSTLALAVRDDPSDHVQLQAYKAMKSFTRAPLKTYFEPGEPVVFDQDFLAQYLPS